MNVLVDTPVWSLSLRRRASNLSGPDLQVTHELSELIRESRAQMAGPIRQELLSGVREKSQFARLHSLLRAFPDVTLFTGDYVQAAAFNNECRRHGIIGSSVDFLLCAAAARRRWAVFTLDADFQLYARHIPVALHLPRKTA